MRWLRVASTGFQRFFMISFYTSLVSQPPDVDGSLRTLCSQLSNVESLVLTQDQRLFVSAHDGVYELFAAADGSCQRRLIEVTVDGVPRNHMKNGLAADGNRLYLACAHVHQSDNPLVRTVLSDLNGVEQTVRGLLQLYMAAFTFRVESWILGCDLRQIPLAFADRLSSLPQDLAPGGLPANVLANGIAIDPGTGLLYLANSAPGLGAAIYRIGAHGVRDVPGRAELWYRPSGCKPNGLKLVDGSLCYTGNGLSSAVLGRVPINADGSAGPAEVIEIAPLRLFEDFDAVRQGFVVAEPGDSTGLQAGALRFVSNAGRTIGMLRHADLRRPCAVAVAKVDGALFAAGSVLIADRHEGRVLAFVPDEPWRSWLRA